MTSRKTEIVVYYMCWKKLCAQELKMYYKLLPGFIEVVFHNDDRGMTVIDLQSTVPDKEHGTHLMKHACTAALSRGITKVRLDDCSDRYRKDHNIYTKVGMLYETDGGPEMTGNAIDIAAYMTDTEPPQIYALNL